MSPHRSALPLWALLAAAPARADVLIVDAQGGADFLDIQSAVDAAAEGDTILVRSGTYDAFEISDKGLHVAAAHVGAVTTGTIRVRGLQAGQAVLLSGLKCVQSAVPPFGGLWLHQCLGSVRADECEFSGKFMNYAGVGGSGAWVELCEDVAFHGCKFEGVGGEQGSAGTLSAGIEARFSNVALFECELSGADGWFYECCIYAPNAGAGYHSSSGFLFAVDTNFLGGDGGDGECGVTPGDGGPGMHLLGTAEAHTAHCTFIGGNRGLSGGIPCGLQYGQDGPPTLIQDGAIWIDLQVPIRTLSIPSLVLDGTRVELRVRANAGDELFVQRALNGAWVYLPELLGPRLLDAAAGLPGIPLGTSPGGETVYHIHVDALIPWGVEATMLLQLRVVEPDGAVALGGCDHVSIVDEEFDGICERPVLVDADALPGGDGRSWGRAFSDLQDALDRAREIEQTVCPGSRPEVWVAEGTYVPHPDVDEFWAFGQMAVYGGFVGDETEREARDWVAHPTFLSGDRNGDDLPGFTNYSDNSRRVLRIHNDGERSVVIDGFTIRGGKGAGASGGGLLVNSANGLSPVEIANCRIEANHADYSGGGLMKGYYSILTVRDCVFAGNRSVRWGGGAYTTEGTIYSGCTFLRNESVEQHGGGLALYSFWSENHVVNCTFVGNTAPMGGAISVRDDYAPGPPTRLAQVTVLGNTAGSGPGGILVTNALAVVENSILWGNSAGGATDESAQIGGLVDIDYCCVQGWTGNLGGDGNIGLDPMLAPDLRLMPGSPCIDAADNLSLPPDELDLDGDGDVLEPWPFDHDGLPRRVDDPAVPDTGNGAPPIVDMGAHEHQVE